MPGLEFSWAALINATAGGLIGGAVSLLVAWCSTRATLSELEEHSEAVATLARGLQEANESGNMEFKYDEDGRPVGILLRIAGTAEGTGSTRATATVHEADGETENSGEEQGDQG